MRLFSAPGSTQDQRRADLLTEPFDLALSVPATATPTRTGDLEWDADDVSGELAWDADDVTGALAWDTADAAGVLTWG